VEWLKVEALSSKPSTEGKRNKKLMHRRAGNMA
jgi:hypothetical protein